MAKRQRNEIKPGAFEVILGKEDSGKQKWLITLALYGKYGLGRQALPAEVKDLMSYHEKIMSRVLKEYQSMENIEGEVCYTSENLPPIPMHKWTNYLEHIERIKEDYNIEENKIMKY